MDASLWSPGHSLHVHSYMCILHVCACRIPRTFTAYTLLYVHFACTCPFDPQDIYHTYIPTCTFCMFCAFFIPRTFTACTFLCVWSPGNNLHVFPTCTFCVFARSFNSRAFTACTSLHVHLTCMWVIDPQDIYRMYIPTCTFCVYNRVGSLENRFGLDLGTPSSML